MSATRTPTRITTTKCRDGDFYGATLDAAGVVVAMSPPLGSRSTARRWALRSLEAATDVPDFADAAAVEAWGYAGACAGDATARQPAQQPQARAAGLTLAHPVISRPGSDAAAAPRRAVHRAFGGGRNLMTPDAWGYAVVGPWAVELSCGDGMPDRSSPTGRGPELVGATVVALATCRAVHRLSRMLDARADAPAYLASLARLLAYRDVRRLLLTAARAARADMAAAAADRTAYDASTRWGNARLRLADKARKLAALRAQSAELLAAFGCEPSARERAPMVAQPQQQQQACARPPVAPVWADFTAAEQDEAASFEGFVASHLPDTGGAETYDEAHDTASADFNARFDAGVTEAVDVLLRRGAISPRIARAIFAFHDVRQPAPAAMVPQPQQQPGARHVGPPAIGPSVWQALEARWPRLAPLTGRQWGAQPAQQQQARAPKPPHPADARRAAVLAAPAGYSASIRANGRNNTLTADTLPAIALVAVGLEEAAAAAFGASTQAVVYALAADGGGPEALARDAWAGLISDAERAALRAGARARVAGGRP